MRRLRKSLLPILVLAALGCDGGTTPNSAAKQEGKPAVPAGELIREAKGVDLGGLSEAQLEDFYRLINAESSACAKPHSLATSLRDDPECRNSMLVAQFIATRLAAGVPAGSIRARLDELTASLTPEDIDIEGRPVFGNPQAPVTVVVFADFQCPMCKDEAPKLRKEVQDRRGQVKLVFKHFPLGGHPRAEPAAIAVEAAGLQGKFWEMHDLVFDHQNQLEDDDLARYAGQIAELDLGRWKADIEAETTKAAVNKDRAEGVRLKIDGTPAVFVDGRSVTPLLWDGEVSAWIDDALRR
jgi:protein-disulfide isomerase